jgi:riboflavin synthase
MFTGIVQEMGCIVRSEQRGDCLELSIGCSLSAKATAFGNSIAVNGVCLTSVPASESWQNLDISLAVFHVIVGPLTLQITNLGRLKTGNWVNLEPALSVGDSLGGHHVQGHVDFLGVVKALEPWNAESPNWPENSASRLQVELPSLSHEFVIPKGSLAIMGISLTVAEMQSLTNGGLMVSFMIIPHTWCHTMVQHLEVGDFVEVELDSQVKTIVHTTKAYLATRFGA